MPEWALLLGAIATVAASWGAARYAGRSSVKVAEVTAGVDAKRAATEEFAEITEGLRTDLTAARVAIGELRAEQDRMQTREASQRAVLMRHAAWDWMAVQALRKAGIEISDPPALTVETT